MMRKFLPIRWLYIIMIVIVCTFFPTSSQTPNCSDVRCVRATHGEDFTLTCKLPCGGGPVMWFVDSIPQNMETQTIMVASSSDSVDTVLNLTGRIYNCRCRGMMENITILVNPVVKIDFSPNPANFTKRTNGTVTCTARSYPTADSPDEFSIQHPANCNVTKSPTSAMDGVIHTINNAQIHDFGEYTCHVNIKKFNLHGMATESLGVGQTDSTSCPTSEPPEDEVTNPSESSEDEVTNTSASSKDAGMKVTLMTLGTSAIITLSCMSLPTF